MRESDDARPYESCILHDFNAALAGGEVVRIRDSCGESEMACVRELYVSDLKIRGRCLGWCWWSVVCV